MANVAVQQPPKRPKIESGLVSERYLRIERVDNFADVIAPKIVFVGAAQSFRPIGGVKIILQQVAMLRSAGFNAYMISNSGFPVWLDDDFVRGNARVIIDHAVPIRPDDAVVLPEGTLDGVLNQAKHWPWTKVLSAMNIVGLRKHPNRKTNWDDVGFSAKLALSEFLHTAMRDEFGWSDVTVVPPTVSENVFYPSSGPKDKTVVVSGRKNPPAHKALRALFDADKDTFGGFTWIDLENRSEYFVADHLRRTTMAVCIGGVEGFGLPPLEAMASGAIPCGYPGAHGPDEFVTSDNGIWSKTDEPEDIFAAMKKAAQMRPKSQRHKKLLAAGQSTAARYRSAVAAEKLVEFWSEHAPRTRNL